MPSIAMTRRPEASSSRRNCAVPKPAWSYDASMLYRNSEVVNVSAIVNGSVRGTTVAFSTTSPVV